MPGASEEFCCLECGGIRDGGIFGAALIGEPGMLGPDGGIIETRGNGVRRGDLAVFILKDVGIGALKDAGARAGKSLRGSEARSVFAESGAAATGFDADHFYFRVAQEIVKEADGVRTAADAGK